MNSFSMSQERHRTPSFAMATSLTSSKSQSEKDSAFSDASSGYLSAVDLTDSEDTGRSSSALGQDHSSPGVAVLGGYPGLSPMIVMNNFVLKQPNSVAPAGKQWGFPSPLEMLPQSQVVLLQPMLPSSNSTVKTTSENHRQSRNYLPILKSYPRIAPYPGEHLSKTKGSSAVRGGGSVPGYEQCHRGHHHGHRQHSTPSPTSRPSNLEAAHTAQAQAADFQEPCASEPQDRPQSVANEANSVFSYSHEFTALSEASGCHGDGCHGDGYQDVLSMDDSKLKRFSNTYNILNNSGLLGITLRTKELIKENRRTQCQLRQLKEHTALLMEALSSGDPELWTKLQLALQATAFMQAENEEQSEGAKAQSILT